MDRPGRTDPCRARVRDGSDGAQPRYPADQRGPASDKRAAPVDHRHLWLPGRRTAHHDGYAWRSDRPAKAAAVGLCRLRAGFAASGLFDQCGDADRQSSGDGDRRRHGGAIDALADLHHVPGPKAALHCHRCLDRGVFGGGRDRSCPGRHPAPVLLVGICLPHRGPGNGAAARARPADAAGVQGSERPPLGSDQRRDVRSSPS